MEAKFSVKNKKIGRDLIVYSEVNGTIPKEQYNSLKGKWAIMHAVNKRLLYDIVSNPIHNMLLTYRVEEVHICDAYKERKHPYNLTDGS